MQFFTMQLKTWAVRVSKEVSRGLGGLRCQLWRGHLHTFMVGQRCEAVLKEDLLPFVWQRTGLEGDWKSPSRFRRREEHKWSIANPLFHLSVSRSSLLQHEPSPIYTRVSLTRNKFGPGHIRISIKFGLSGFTYFKVFTSDLNTKMIEVKFVGRHF